MYRFGKTDNNYYDDSLKYFSVISGQNSKGGSPFEAQRGDINIRSGHYHSLRKKMFPEFNSLMEPCNNTTDIFKNEALLLTEKKEEFGLVLNSLKLLDSSGIDCG